MRAAKDSIGINRDQYYVECGKLQNGKQPRFYLGRTNEVSEDGARIRRARVREFWNKYRQHNRLNGYPLEPGIPTLSFWNDTALDYAKQIGKGAIRLVFELSPAKPHHEVLEAIANLNTHYDGIVTFIASSDRTDAVKSLGDSHRTLATAARLATPTVTSIINDDNTETLHKWLDLFAAHNRRTLTEADDDGKQVSTEWGSVVVKTVELIRRGTPDMPLDRFG